MVSRRSGAVVSGEAIGVTGLGASCGFSDITDSALQAHPTRPTTRK